MEKAQLLFFDDFKENTLDASKWELCPEQSRQGGAAFWDDRMTFFDGTGHLVLRAEWDGAAGGIRSGGIRTKDRFEGGFGYYEASIKFPVAKGIWGAFWLMCGAVERVSGTAADGVEIDIVESIFNDRGGYNAALHYDGYGADLKSVKSGTRYDADIYDGNFHTFALDRTADHYAFYIDGEEFWHVTPDECAPCAENGFLKLTVEAAAWAGIGTEDSISALPADMLVDYVKVYSKNPYKS